jgi:hypothetical protein
MAFVAKSLNEFLNEWVDKAEDRWADREIDKWEKRESGINPNEDPEEILNYPEEVEIPNNVEILRKIIYSIIDLKKRDGIDPEEFKNFCIWVTRIANNPNEAMSIVSGFIERIPSMLEELERNERNEGSLIGGAFHEGFEVLADAYRPKDTDNMDNMNM